MSHDFCVVGGGIVGLAVAAEILARRPGASLVLIEKEQGLAQHQTGHNSGVIHSGIYYEPGSLKATLCKAGAAITKELAAEYGIPVDTCGKLLVATTPREVARMDALAERGRVNGIPIERIDAAELCRREPAVVGLAALYAPTTGVVDYVRVTEALAERVRVRGGTIETGAKVTSIAESSDAVRIEASGRVWAAGSVVVCAGLQADRLARLAGIRTEFQIVPFRGEYYRLPPSRDTLINHLVYPIPDPDLPFLGIHLTRTVDGGVTVGPNAVLGMAREGYPKGSIALRDVAEYLRFPGMWRVARRQVAVGAREIRNSLFRRAYLAECRKYCPDLTVADLLPAPAGIRAQAVLRDGTLVEDFRFLATDRTLHVCNAPSPAATSALPIAGRITDRLLRPA
ncbi:MAG: L-2-hydroxyglutarate oxidase [Solirubrobacteraceae bacterium]